MQKTIIFDFDGTIADSILSNAEILEIFNKIANENNFKNITLKEVKKLRDIGLFESIQLLKIPFYKIPFIAKRVRTIVKADETISNPIKEMPETLKKLKKQNYTLGIMTSNKKESVEKFLKKHDLEVFDFIYSGSNLFGKDKVLKNLFKKQNIDPKHSVYVGDEIRDIQAAKKINLRIIAITWGYNSKKGLLKYKPDYLIAKPSELEKDLKAFFST
jgi:phosphoglycolate phosphatase